jgi:hypothetical protein
MARYDAKGKVNGTTCKPIDIAVLNVTPGGATYLPGPMGVAPPISVGAA